MGKAGSGAIARQPPIEFSSFGFFFDQFPLVTYWFFTPPSVALSLTKGGVFGADRCQGLIGVRDW